MNIRPKGSNMPQYAPQRDLAYLFAPAMTEALLAFQETHWTPEYEQLCQQLGINRRDLVEGVATLARCHETWVNTPGIETANDALKAGGWYDLPVGVRYLIYGRFGEVMLGGCFIATRDITQQNDPPDIRIGIENIIAAGRLIRENAMLIVFSDDEISQMRMSLNSMTARLQLTEQAHDALRKQSQETAMRFAHQEASLKAYKRDHEALLKKPFWSRLWWACTHKIPTYLKSS